jgi:hypothetical protein
MKTIIISTLFALSIAAAMNVADFGVAAAQGAVCFRGDTMDRDGGHSGALGAPKCDGNYAQRVVLLTNRVAA